MDAVDTTHLLAGDDINDAKDSFPSPDSKRFPTNSKASS